MVDGRLILHCTFDIGYISRKNLREVLGKNCAEREIDDVINSVDTSRDGKSTLNLK